MTTETKDTTKAVLRDLASAIASRPDRVRVECHESAEGRIFWEMVCHPDDQGALIGKFGAHVKAFGTLVSKMGEADGERWEFKLERIPGQSIHREAYRPVRHNPTGAWELLARVLQEIPIGQFTVEPPRTEANDPFAFHFDIRASSKGDAYALNSHMRDGDPDSSILASLGTLFRAIGRKNGCKFQVNVVT